MVATPTEPGDSHRATVLAAVERLLKGESVHDVIEQVAPRIGPGSGGDQARILLDAYDELLRRTGEADIRRALHLEQRRELFKLALSLAPMEPAALNTALRTLQDLAKIEGIYDRPSGDPEDDAEARPYSNAPTIEELDYPIQ